MELAAAVLQLIGTVRLLGTKFVRQVPVSSRVNSEVRTITLELTIDTEISQVMEYFEIFLGRMQMCRLAAEMLGCKFRLTVNGAQLA